MVQQIADSTLTHEERTLLRCRLAKSLEDSGNFRAARETLGELWEGVGTRPNLQELSTYAAAELLLRSGTLAGWLGSSHQIEGSQESAKNLISESITSFESLEDRKKTAEARIELGYCYWREGAFNEARDLLRDSLTYLTDKDAGLKATGLLRLAVVEHASFRLNDALHLLTDAAPLFEACDNCTLKGRFHAEYGTVLKNLGAVERRGDYVDRALIEFAAASYHFEQAGHRRYQACVENNLGMLFCTAGRYEEAHEHLDRAQALLTSMRDVVHLAQTDETRARVLLAQGRCAEAERLVRGAAEQLERGGEQALLAEALTTQGIALARLGRREQARATLERASEVAESAGDNEGAGRAAITLIEELGDDLLDEELFATYERADRLVGNTRHPETQDRLLGCVRRILFLAGYAPEPPSWERFSFDRVMLRYEAGVIDRALRASGGIISRAAQLLGLKRQSLSSMLHTRHRRLLTRHPQVEPLRMQGEEGEDAERRDISVLCAEDSPEVAEAIREALEGEGWRVCLCSDFDTARGAIEGAEHFDLFVFDHSLPGGDGLDLTRLTRTLPHRRRTPVLMLTASEVEEQALRAGVNAFLRKPREVAGLIETASRLLRRTSDG
jgi:CheY-like chemotaxis protein/tetratricopeptide (TPR) repeat protein